MVGSNNEDNNYELSDEEKRALLNKRLSNEELVKSFNGQIDSLFKRAGLFIINQIHDYGSLNDDALLKESENSIQGEGMLAKIASDLKDSFEKGRINESEFDQINKKIKIFKEVLIAITNSDPLNPDIIRQKSTNLSIANTLVNQQIFKGNKDVVDSYKLELEQVLSKVNFYDNPLAYNENKELTYIYANPKVKKLVQNEIKRLQLDEPTNLTPEISKQLKENIEKGLKKLTNDTKNFPPKDKWPSLVKKQKIEKIISQSFEQAGKQLNLEINNSLKSKLSKDLYKILDKENIRNLNDFSKEIQTGIISSLKECAKLDKNNKVKNIDNKLLVKQTENFLNNMKSSSSEDIIKKASENINLQPEHKNILKEGLDKFSLSERSKHRNSLINLIKDDLSGAIDLSQLTKKVQNLFNTLTKFKEEKILDKVADKNHDLIWNDESKGKATSKFNSKNKKTTNLDTKFTNKEVELLINQVSKSNKYILDHPNDHEMNKKHTIIRDIAIGSIKNYNEANFNKAIINLIDSKKTDSTNTLGSKYLDVLKSYFTAKPKDEAQKKYLENKKNETIDTLTRVAPEDFVKAMQSVAEGEPSKQRKSKITELLEKANIQHNESKPQGKNL